MSRGIDDVTRPLSAERPEADGSPRHRREQVRLDPHLHPEDGPPAAAGPQQQLSDRPATGHGQVTDDTDTLTPGRSERATVQICTSGINVNAVCLQDGAAGHSVRPQEQPDVPPSVPLQHLHTRDDRGQR